MSMKTLTVRDLKRILKDIPDNTKVVRGWQFRDVICARIKTINLNGKQMTGFQILNDPDDIED